MNQKGIAQIVVVLIILAGLALGVYLIGQKTFFKPKAGLEGTRIEFAGPNVAGDKTTSGQVKLKAYYVPPTVSAPVGGTYPTPTSPYGTPAYSTPSGATTSSVEYKLFAGDNFIGLPFDYTFTDITPVRLLSDTNGKCSAIWTTDANAGKMLVYPAGTKVTDYFTGTEVPDSKKGGIGNLAGGSGYFIRCSGSTTVTITAKPLSVDEAFRLSGYQKDPNYPIYVAAPFNNQNLGASRVKTLDLLNKMSRGSLSCTEVLTPRVVCTTSGEACSISGTTSYVKGGYGNFTLRDDTGYAVKCSAKSTPVSAPVSIGVQGTSTGSYVTPPAGGGAYPTHFRVSNDTVGLSNASENEFKGNPTEIDWTLPAGNGTKTVYAEFKLNGVWGNRVQASITLAEPSVSGPVGPTPTPSPKITLTPPSGSYTPNASGTLALTVKSANLISISGTIQNFSPNRTLTIMLCPAHKATCEYTSTPAIIADSSGSANFDNILTSIPNPQLYVNNPLTKAVVVILSAKAGEPAGCSDRFKPCLEGSFSISSTPSPSPTSIPAPTVRPTPSPISSPTPTLRPTPSPTLRPSPTPTPTTTPQPVACTACSADINKDGVVNMQDFSRLSSCFNRRSTDTVAGVACANADLNGDRVVTILDYSCLASKFNQRCEANLTTQPKVSTKTVVNNLPTITSSVSRGFFTTIVITAKDVDRDNINVTISGKPANSYGPYCFGSNGVRTCYIYTRAGSGTMTATATDGKGGTATTTINVLR